MIVFVRRRLSAKRRFCLPDLTTFFIILHYVFYSVSSTTPFVLILFDVSLIGHARILVMF